MKLNMEEVLASMTTEQYRLTVGEKSTDPLTGVFRTKRVVHPGVRGAMVLAQKWQERWRSLLADSPESNRARAAYIHIPFCSHKCLYCGFFQNYTQAEQERLYVEALIKEMKSEAEMPRLKEAPLEAVYIGGGTPSALSPEDILRLLEAIKKYLPLANDCEFTLEARIHDLCPEKAEAWFAGGVNRISIGVQTFDTQVRRMVGRIDDRETVIERLRMLASYRQAAVVIDLIYGLPGQTLSMLLDDLAAFCDLPIDGMDLYQLNLFDGGPLKKAIKTGAIPPAASTLEQAKWFREAECYLNGRALLRKSNCHWARTGRERNLYNQISKCGAELFPFGAGAGGSIGGIALFLQRDMKKYLHAVERGEKPVMFMSQEPPSQALHNSILKQLELGYLHLGELAGLYGEAVHDAAHLLELWEERGLMIKERTLYRLTVAGRFWQMNIAQSLLECLEILNGGTRQCIVEKIAGQG